MAKKKQEEAPAGAPAWMATFSDLMNLLLCFFVLLFSMSSVDQAKFEALIASLQSQYSILTGGGSAVGDGSMISAGISMMQKYDVYFNPKATTSGDGPSDSEKDIVKTESDSEGKPQEVGKGYVEEGGKEKGSIQTEEEAFKIAQQAELEESQKMAERVERLLSKYNIQDKVNVDFNGQYVLMTLNGAVLFESGASELTENAYPLMDKLGIILKKFAANIIEIEGHTDNVPVHNERFEDNNVLSMYRSLSVADYLRSTTSLKPENIKSSGRGDYVPVADNATPQGRAKNRRVEIKVYNSYNSDKK